MVVVAPALEALIVNGKAPEVPPPGAGVKTLTWAVPAAATSDGLMVASSSLLDVSVVVRALEFHCTTESGVKLVPTTLSEKAALPATIEPGVNDVIVGAAAVTVNDIPPDVPPPGEGLETVTVAVSADATSAVVIAACSDVLEP